MSNHNKIIPDSFGAFLVEGARFTDEEEYPILEQWMVTKELPKAILPFNKALNCREDISNTYVCTYSPDRTFERVRRNPQQYIDFFKSTAGIIGFDFSVHDDMPIIKQKSQMNDNLSLMYYFGKQGIPILPNVRCGIDELMPEYLSAFPKGCIIAVGTHGFYKERRERFEWRCFLDEVIDELHPSDIVVYGSLNDEIFDEVKQRTNIVTYTPWITANRKQRCKHVD